MKWAIGICVMSLFACAGLADQLWILRLAPAPFPAPGGCTATTGNPRCGYSSAEDVTKLVYEFMGIGPDCAWFPDPLPAGSTATAIDLAISYAPTLQPETVTIYRYTPGSAASRQVIGSLATETGTFFQGCDNQPRDQMRMARIAGTEDSNGLQGYAYGGTNRFITDDLNFSFLCEFVDVTIHYKSPPKIDFDLHDTTLSTERRVLISRARSEIAYPSTRQQSIAGADADRDRRIRIAGTVTDENGLLANATVYLRVTDPPDAAPYTPASIRKAGDNSDSGGGFLRETTVTSDQYGRFETILTVTDHAAGDNYRVEGSTIPAFGSKSTCDAANNCYRTGVITAWKRIHVEKMKMLRNGMFIDKSAAAGDSSIVIRGNRYRGNAGHDRLSRGDRIVLVHAPQLDRSDAPAGWYKEIHTILAVTEIAGTGTYLVELGTRSGQTVNREFLAHAYGPDLTDNNLGDGIARIGAAAITPDDLFDARNDLVVGSVFPEAFTEYVYVSAMPNADVPVARFESEVQPQLQHLADKWSSLVTWSGTAGVPLPNHQLLMIADSNGNSTANSAGLTIDKVPGETASFVWRGTIESVVRSRNSGDADLWAMKTCAHELTHQWYTNTIWSITGVTDHCPSTTRGYSLSNVYCLMADADPAGSETQRSNGIAQLHMVPDPVNPASWHSEYFGIRRHRDPFLP